MKTYAVPFITSINLVQTANVMTISGAKSKEEAIELVSKKIDENQKGDFKPLQIYKTAEQDLIDKTCEDYILINENGVLALKV